MMVMLVLLRLGDEAYGVPISEEIEKQSGHDIAVGSVYAALERLEARGLVSSRVGEPTAERGGRAKRYFKATGKGLKEIAERMAFSPEQCILLYDEFELPLGSVRARMSGGAGGHRGVASILVAFQTDSFRRVKVGVGRPGGNVDRTAYVVTPFAPADEPTVDRAIALAEARTLDMVEHASAAKAL